MTNSKQQDGVRVIHAPKGSPKRPYYVTYNNCPLVDRNGRVRRFATFDAAHRAATVQS